METRLQRKIKEEVHKTGSKRNGKKNRFNYKGPMRKITFPSSKSSIFHSSNNLSNGHAFKRIMNPPSKKKIINMQTVLTIKRTENGLFELIQNVSKKEKKENKEEEEKRKHEIILSNKLKKEKKLKKLKEFGLFRIHEIMKFFRNFTYFKINPWHTDIEKVYGHTFSTMNHLRMIKQFSVTIDTAILFLKTPTISNFCLEELHPIKSFDALLQIFETLSFTRHVKKLKVVLSMLNETFIVPEELVAGIVDNNPLEVFKVSNFQISGLGYLLSRSVRNNISLKKFIINNMDSMYTSDRILVQNVLEAFKAHPTIECLHLPHLWKCFPQMKEFVQETANLRKFVLCNGWKQNEIQEIIKIINKKEQIKKISSFEPQSSSKYSFAIEPLVGNNNLTKFKVIPPLTGRKHDWKILIHMLWSCYEMETILLPHYAENISPILQALCDSKKLKKIQIPCPVQILPDEFDSDMDEEDRYASEEELALQRKLIGQLLRNHPSMKSLNYPDCDICYWPLDEQKAIFELIASNNCLKKFTIYPTKKSQDILVELLCPCIRENHTLQKLKIKGNFLSSQAIIELFVSLRSNNSITSISLNSKKISPAAMTEIYNTLYTTKTISKIGFDTEWEIDSYNFGFCLGMMKKLQITLNSMTMQSILGILDGVQEYARMKNISLQFCSRFYESTLLSILENLSKLKYLENTRIVAMKYGSFWNTDRILPYFTKSNSNFYIDLRKDS